jgi:hypothetical protein
MTWRDSKSLSESVAWNFNRKAKRTVKQNRDNRVNSLQKYLRLCKLTRFRKMIGHCTLQLIQIKGILYTSEQHFKKR